MKAFNGRITSPTIGKYRLPLYAVMLWVLAFLAVVFALVVPLPFKLLLALLAFGCVLAGIFVFILKDRLIFLRIHFEAFGDANKRSIDACEE